MSIEEDGRLKEIGEISGNIESWTDQYPVIFKNIPIPEGLILDVGSYDVRFSRWVRSRGIERNVVSLDVRSDVPVSEDDDFVRASARSLPFHDESFEAVVSFGAVPWLLGRAVPDAEAIREMVRVAQKRVIIWPSPTDWTKNEIRENMNQDIKDHVLDLLQGSKVTEVQVITVTCPGSLFLEVAARLLIIDK